MLLVNVNTKQFIPSPGSNFIQPVENRDQIILGTRREVRFQLYNTDGTVFALNESDTFCCAGDINFIHTDDLMFYSGHEMCRIIDAAQGIVGVTIDATSDSFAAKATSQNTRMYVQLKRHVAGDTLGDTVLQDIVYAQPAVMTTEGAPASSDPEYMTAAATLALLRTAPDYQFSVDGETNWHDQQDIAADRFYRERRNGGEWGPAIELIEGKAGTTGAAAGFGAPTIAVETLPAGSDATASVTASGDDTAKVFSFSLGIPKGADGTGAGDMTKAVYDTNDDGIVDHAATADAVGATTAAQVADAVSKAHAHANKATLDKLAEADGKLTFDGSEIGGASNWNDITGKPETFPPSAHNHAITDVTGLEDALQNAGSVKSVNGQLPDESGAVTLPNATTSVAGLMAAADKTAIAGLTTSGIYPNASARSGAVDFNDVIGHGMYFIGGDTPHLNYPETYQQNGGFSQVLRNGNYLVQTFTPLNTNKVFIRSGLKALSDLSERTFSAWRRLLTDEDITESKAQPGYFKLPGGTIVQWGATTDLSADGTTEITLPLAFPNEAFVAIATATVSGITASAIFSGTTKLNVIAKGYTSTPFKIYWVAIGR